jgi:glycosyltransferase involved in cell wall biosynthesis
MRLSVIVCTRNRAPAVPPCLDSIKDSLARASLDGDAEIVVVDNASEDDTSAVVQAWAAANTIGVKLCIEPKKGLAAARNCGLGAARGDLLAFTDDDCRMSPTYVVELLEHDSRDVELTLRGGRVVLGDPTDLPLTIKDTVLRRWSRRDRSARHENLGNALLGCNMAMRRGVADRIGPFDERLGAGSGIPGGEDTDYVLRAYLADVVIEQVPDMAVSHFHGRRSIAEANRLFKNYTLGSGALYAKYLFKDPDLCRQFYWDVKDACRELVTGRDGFAAEYDFSSKAKVAFSVLGALRFWVVAVNSM